MVHSRLWNWQENKQKASSGPRLQPWVVPVQMPMAPTSQCQRRRPRVAMEGMGSAGTQPILVPVQTPPPQGPHLLICQVGDEHPSWQVAMGSTKMMSVRESGSMQESTTAAPFIPHSPKTRPLAVSGVGCVLHTGDWRRGTNGAEIWSYSISQASRPGVSLNGRSLCTICPLRGATLSNLSAQRDALFLSVFACRRAFVKFAQWCVICQGWLCL